MLLSTPPFDKSFIAPDFSLYDVVSDKKVSLNDYGLDNGFVVAFICNHCPYVHEIIKDFVKIADELKKQGVLTFAIMSNNYDFVQIDSPENMKIFAQQNKFSFPYLVDEDQSVAKAFGAVCTPDIFAFNKEKQLRYRGRINELEQAMLEISEKGFTEINQKPSRGCSIKWK